MGRLDTPFLFLNCLVLLFHLQLSKWTIIIFLCLIKLASILVEQWNWIGVLLLIKWWCRLHCDIMVWWRTWHWKQSGNVSYARPQNKLISFPQMLESLGPWFMCSASLHPVYVITIVNSHKIFIVKGSVTVAR